MDSCCSFLACIKHDTSFLNPVQTSHDRCLYQTHGSIYVVVLYAWDQHLLCLLHEVVLDGADVLDIADVLVELWVDGHVFGTHGKPLPMLVLVLDVEHEWYACWVLGHHLFQE